MEAAQFFSFFDMPFHPLSPSVSSRLMAGEKLMLVEHRVKKGHSAIGDCHENEQLTLILSGKVRFAVNGEVRVLERGDSILIPPGVIHDIEVLEESVVIEVFSPPRTEWVQKLQSQNR